MARSEYAIVEWDFKVILSRFSLEPAYNLILIFASSPGAITMWVPYVTGTPELSQIGSLIYEITHIQIHSVNFTFLTNSWSKV